ncbi:type IV pilus modification protein PilV [Pseudomonas nitroreducens]|nr:type IV pilus modification protein PilV [Pseudomonas nitritireducens]
MNNQPKHQTGFSMIEVLVALLLICIGVLGMVAMQGRTIQYNVDATQRSNAAMLANELLETMRSNRDQVYSSTNSLNGSSPYFKLDSASYPTALAANECQPLPPNSNAAKQLSCWLTRVRQILPDAGSLGSEVHVCQAGDSIGTCGTSGRGVEIQLAWRVKDGECLDTSSAAGSDGTICHYRIRAEI